MEALKLIAEVEISPISNLHFHSTLVALFGRRGQKSTAMPWYARGTKTSQNLLTRQKGSSARTASQQGQ